MCQARGIPVCWLEKFLTSGNLHNWEVKHSTRWCSPRSHQGLGGVLSTEVVKGDGSSGLIFRVETLLELYLFSQNIQTSQIYKIRPQCLKPLLLWSFPIWAKKKKKKKILHLVMPCCSELTSVMAMCNFWGIPYGMSHHTANFLCFKIILFIYLVLTVLGLHCWEGVFPSCGEQGLLWSWCTSLSLQSLLSLWNRGSRASGLQ